MDLLVNRKLWFIFCPWCLARFTSPGSQSCKHLAQRLMPTISDHKKERFGCISTQEHMGSWSFRSQQHRREGSSVLWWDLVDMWMQLWVLLLRYRCRMRWSTLELKPLATFDTCSAIRNVDMAWLAHYLRRGISWTLCQLRKDLSFSCFPLMLFILLSSRVWWLLAAWFTPSCQRCHVLRVCVYRKVSSLLNTHVCPRILGCPWNRQAHTCKGHLCMYTDVAPSSSW